MKIYVCTDHDGHWPVGVASVIVAEDEAQAQALLDAALIEHGLRTSEKYPYTFQELDVSAPHAQVLLDGDY